MEFNIHAEGVGGNEPKYKEWEIEDAVRCIIHAEEVKQDKELMALVAPRLQKTVNAAANAAKVLYKGEDKNEG